MVERASYLKRLNSESVVQRVINCLTDAMLTKQLKPGDKIPTEMELSESLGVGRNSIREAIKNSGISGGAGRYAEQREPLSVRDFPRA